MSANAAATHEFALEPADNARLASLCGALDENLRLIESRLGVKIRRRGQSFRVQGEYAEAAEGILKDLYTQARHHDLSAEQVHLCLVEHASGGQGDGADSVVMAGDAERGAAGRRESVRARGAHQRDYLTHIRNHDLSFGIGPAGTGKTYLAVACAVEALLSERVRRIVLVRPAVEAGERLGFLPGDMAQKVDPYLRPMYDALYELMGFDRVARFIERNAIEVAPLAFMRGRSLNESFIILDEAQNTTIEQM